MVAFFVSGNKIDIVKDHVIMTPSVLNGYLVNEFESALHYHLYQAI